MYVCLFPFHAKKALNDIRMIKHKDKYIIPIYITLG